jgi:hypothetical protein
MVSVLSKWNLFTAPVVGASLGLLPARGITEFRPDDVVTFPTRAPPGPIVLEPGTGCLSGAA